MGGNKLTHQRCYKLKNQKPTQTASPIWTSPSPSSQSETTPMVTKEDLRNNTDDSIKTAFLVILALALAGVIVFFFILFYKRKSLNLERFFKVLTCDDVKTGPVDGTENEEDIQPQELTNEVDESSHLLTGETGRDEKATSDKDLAPNDSTISEPISGNIPFEKDTLPSDLAIVSNSSSSTMPVIGIALVSAPISNDGIGVSHSSSIDDVPSSTPIVGDDPDKLNSDKDIDSNAKSKQEPVGDKPMPNNEAASIRKSDTLLNSSSNLDTERFMKAKSDNNSLSKPKSIDFSLSQVKSDTKNTSKPPESENDPTEISIPANNKTEDKSRDAYEEKFKENPPKSNNGHTLKPVSNENISSKSTSLEACDSRQVSNDKTAADPLLASHTSSSSVSPLEITKENMKEVVIDDSKEIPTDLSNDNPAPDSCASKPISAINPFDEDSTPSATSEKDPAPNDSTNLKPISGNNPFKEDTKPSEFGKTREAPRRPPYPYVTKIDIPRNAPLGKGRAPLPPPGQPRKSRNVVLCGYAAVLLDSTGENVLHPADIQTMVNDVSKGVTALKNFAITSKDAVLMVFVVAIVQHLVYILITVSSASTAVTVLRSYAIILQDVQDSKSDLNSKQKLFTVPGDLDENVNITNKTIMEKHQTEFVIGICISVVLVVVSVSVIIKLRRTKKTKEDTPQTLSSYVECPMHSMRSGHSYESLFVNRRNDPDAYENTRYNNSF
uniref:Uncharacterized protein n=1 Tax=Magallana gigas TaxID=29159 RepID=K1RDP7_MAGGI